MSFLGRAGAELVFLANPTGWRVGGANRRAITTVLERVRHSPRPTIRGRPLLRRARVARCRRGGGGGGAVCRCSSKSGPVPLVEKWATFVGRQSVCPTRTLGRRVLSEVLQPVATAPAARARTARTRAATDNTVRRGREVHGVPGRSARHSSRERERACGGSRRARTAAEGRRSRGHRRRSAAGQGPTV